MSGRNRGSLCYRSQRIIDVIVLEVKTEQSCLDVV